MSVKIAYPINFCIKNVKCNLLRHAYKLQKTPTNKRGISKECQVHIIKSYQLIPIYATYKLAPLGIKLVIGALHCSSSSGSNSRRNQHKAMSGQALKSKLSNGQSALQ